MKADPADMEKVALADGEYMREKEKVNNSHQITVVMIEKRFGLKPGQLANYRANHYSRRKHEGF